MSTQPDDLDAVRIIVQTLHDFDPDDRTRILRWVHEKLGIAPISTPNVAPALVDVRPAPDPSVTAGSMESPPILRNRTDIKSFVESKQPNSDQEFTAVVSYYYQFEADEAHRKESITGDDLLEACRLVGRERFTRPAQTLINAHTSGLIDKTSERGSYAISTVGENLVAMALPGDPGASRRQPVRSEKEKSE